MADLEDLLTEYLSRRVTREELSSILGISVATYARRKSSGYPADDVIKVARHFGRKPAEMLVDLGILEIEDVALASQQFGLTGLPDSALLSELHDRAVIRESGGEDVAVLPWIQERDLPKPWEGRAAREVNPADRRPEDREK